LESKKLVWEASRLEKRNVLVIQLHNGGSYLKFHVVSVSKRCEKFEYKV